MAVIAGDLVTRLGIDGRKFKSGLDSARGDARSFVADVGKIVSGLAIYDIGKSIASSIFGMAKATVSLAADAQVTRAEFGVLLGDVDKGVAMFKQIEKFAARTSFNIESASDAMRSLMAAGVKEGDLLDTMQLLGDLSLGDANKLGFLSKAYTDVFNKGRLQGQELKQFAENGVGLVQALSGTLGKPAEEILKMSENGQISFKMMQDALKSLTAEGGRFFGAMEAKNKTFWGQWDSTIEAIQSTGRAIGEKVLPRLTEIVAETNKMVQAFNSLGEDRWKFLGEVLVASFDVGMETIKLHWADMLNSMIDQVSEIPWSRLLNPFGSININDLRPSKKPENLQEAQGRLDGLMQKLGNKVAENDAAAETAKMTPSQASDAAFKKWQDSIAAFGKANDEARTALEKWKATAFDSPNFDSVASAYDAANKKSLDIGAAMSRAKEEYNKADAVAQQDAQAKAKEEAQSKFTSGISSWLDGIKQSASGGLLSEISGAAQGVFDRTKIEAGALQGMFANWFGSPDWEKKQQKQEEPRLAGAMQKGSQEAFSTIFAAMIQKGKDPVVKATEKGAAAVVKAIKMNKPQVILAMGAVNP